MRLLAAACSHVGKVRRKNEDNLCFGGEILPELKEEACFLQRDPVKEEIPFFAVFDGMGGYAGGERASWLMAELAQQMCAGSDRPLTKERLLQLCFDANEAVCDEMERSGYAHMGTTASMLYFGRKTYTLCNIGDSPVFRFREGMLTAIHQEHTERSVYEAVTGRTAEPGRKFRLTQNIGLPSDEVLIERYVCEDKLKAGDVFLICSDGITDMVPVSRIISVLKQVKDPSVIARYLLELALEAGGKDNATVICIRAAGIFG